MMIFKKVPSFLLLSSLVMTQAYTAELSLSFKGRGILGLKKDDDGQVCKSLNPMLGTDGLSFLTDSLKDVTFKASKDFCTNARITYVNDYERFSPKRCEAAYYCTYGKINGIEDENKRKGAQVALKYMAAKTLINGQMKSKAYDMEKLEILKRFAEKKYGAKIGADCSSRFYAKEDTSCKLQLVEKSFRDSQSSCAGQIGCYNTNDEYNYQNFVKDIKPGEPSILSYFENIVSKKLSNSLSNETDYLKSLASLYSSKEFITASQAKKDEMIIEAINHNDPVLSMDLDIVGDTTAMIKEKTQFKQLKNLFLKKGVTQKDFIAQVDGFRKKRTEALLEGTENECSKLPTIQSICSDATKILRGEKVKNINASALGSKLNLQSFNKESKGYEILKKFMGDQLADEYDLELFLDAERCVAFGFLDDRKKEKNEDPELSKNREREDNIARLFSSEGGSTKDQRYDIDSDESLNDTLVSLGLKERKTDIAGTTNKEAEFDLKEPVKDNTSHSTHNEESFNNTNYFNPNAYNNTNNQFVQKDFTEIMNKDSAKDASIAQDTVKADPGVSGNDKLNELMKKLAVTEEKLDKLKAANDEAEENRIKEKKIQEENAVIADLKSQISELKNKSAKTNAPVNNVQENRNNNIQSTGSSFGSSSIRSADIKSGHNEMFDGARAKSDAAPAANANSTNAVTGRSIASSPVLSATNAENSAGAALTLTKVDGMTSEKAAETISSRIKELNGVPFLIEEDGVTKKVIPLIKDGKIELDENGQPKYVKIKVNRKECTEEEKEKGSCRAPASIAKVNTTVADEKREQEEKTKRELERAQYLKFKAISKKALDKKQK